MCKKKFRNLVALKSYKQQLEDKTPNGNNFGCSRKEDGPVITETELKQFTKNKFMIG